MRHIDRVTVKGSKQPMDLYTCDMDPEMINKTRVAVRRNEQQVDKRIIRFLLFFINK